MPAVRHSCVQLAFSAVAAIGLHAADAFAGIGPVEPGLQILIAVDDGDALSVDPGGTHVSGSLFNYEGSLLDESGWSLSWNLNADADPFINGNLVVENLTLNTLEFDLTVLLPVVIGPSTLTGGSAAFGLTTDSGGGTLSTAGGPGWEALIDNAVHASLFPQPTSATLPGLGSTGFFGSFGTPIPSQAGPAVASSIGIHIHFTLTPGDQASITSVFVVNQVPGPAALALIGVGLARHRRRR